MKQLFLLLSSGLCLLSCQSSEERAINHMLTALDGNWKITSFQVHGNAADSLKNYFKEGSLQFDPCRYTEKHFADQARVCGGKGMINNQEVFFTHRFFKIGVPFDFSMHLRQKPTNHVDVPLLVTSGQWEFHLESTLLKARQVYNRSLPEALVEFTAVKE